MNLALAQTLEKHNCESTLCIILSGITETATINWLDTDIQSFSIVLGSWRFREKNRG